MTDSERADVRLSCKLETDHGYGMDRTLRFRADVVYMSADDGKVRSFSGSYADESALADLGVSAQSTTSNSYSDAGGTFYGYGADYLSPYRVDQARAEMMVKTLRSVTRKLEKLSSQLGEARDLAAYLPRFAIAIGATGPAPFLRRIEGEERDLYGDGYKHMNADSLGYWLDHELAAFHKVAVAS